MAISDLGEGQGTRLGRMVAAGLMALGSGGALIGCNDGSDDKRVIEIGFLVHYAEVTLTQLRLNEMLLTLQNINEQGGLQLPDGNYLLDVYAADDGGTTEVTRRSLQEMQARGITAVVGPPWSSLVLGQQPDHSDGAVSFAREARMVMVSGSATAGAIRDLDDENLMWRTVANDDVQAQVAANHLFELGHETASVLFRDDAWGTGLARAFEEAFTQLGGTVLASVAYVAEADPQAPNRDYSVELTQLFEGQPQAICLFNFAEFLDIASQIDTGGYLAAYESDPPYLFGSDGIYTADLLTNVPDSILDGLEGTVPSADSSTADYQAFAELMAAGGIDEPLGADANRHDAAYLLALAIQAAQSTDADAIAAALGPISRQDPGDVEVHVNEWSKAREALLAGQGINYEGASGPIEFDDQGDIAVGTIAIWDVQRMNDAYILDESTVVPFDLR